MSRAAVPSHRQVEILMDWLEKTPYLASGHARTAFARNRTRNAWQEIAYTLNNEPHGCIKTWQEWAKYWKDKKGYLKKKTRKSYEAREYIDGVNEEPMLTDVEKRILALIDPFELSQQSESQIEQEPAAAPVAPSAPGVAIVEVKVELDEVDDDYTPTPVQSDTETKLEDPIANASQPVSSPSPGRSVLPPRRPFHTTHQRRRRLIRKSRPGQRHSLLATLTQRFLALEERRVQAEVRNSQALSKMADALHNISTFLLKRDQ